VSKSKKDFWDLSKRFKASQSIFNYCNNNPNKKELLIERNSKIDREIELKNVFEYLKNIINE
jgi:hypothetical protein